MSKKDRWTIEWTMSNGRKCYPNDFNKSCVIGNFTANIKCAKVMRNGETAHHLYLTPKGATAKIIPIN